MAVDTTRRERTEHGVDLDAYMGFIDWVAENPGDAAIEFRASGTAEEVANRTTSSIGDLGARRRGDG
ncbi:hypothetical protein [Natronorarus salvus]|uniref:hypothetical protein n=1 Tax=Natronorarus salvus TaxID=3117733 RepID=UPI002F2669AE